MYYNVVGEDDDDVHDYCGGDLDDDGDDDDDDDDDEGDDGDDDDDDDNNDNDTDGGDDDNAGDVGDSEVMMVLMVERTCPLFTRLTLKCASRHNGVHFFHISTSRSGPRMVCLVHFGMEMCFAPQRRPLFPHLNFQEWSENGIPGTF